jgi:hypothetical protein
LVSFGATSTLEAKVGKGKKLRLMIRQDKNKLGDFKEKFAIIVDLTLGG